MVVAAVVVTVMVEVVEVVEVVKVRHVIIVQQNQCAISSTLCVLLSAVTQTLQSTRLLVA